MASRGANEPPYRFSDASRSDWPFECPLHHILPPLVEMGLSFSPRCERARVAVKIENTETHAVFDKFMRKIEPQIHMQKLVVGAPGFEPGAPVPTYTNLCS